jgi:hypothetical protein
MGKIRGIEDEDDDEYENDARPQELVPTALSLPLVQHLECGSCSLRFQRKQAGGVGPF